MENYDLRRIIPIIVLIILLTIILLTLGMIFDNIVINVLSFDSSLSLQHP